MNDVNLLAGTLGVLIVVGLIVLIIIEASSPTRFRTITRTDILPVAYPSGINYRPRRPPYYPDYRPVKPYIPAKIVGDRSTPFCEHTSYGCYPGTQTPIP
jgi:hypothetical protein